MRGLSPDQLPLTILGAASPLLTDMGLSPALAADSLSWSALPELEPVSVTCRKPSSSALASTGWVKVTASARLSRNWRDWQFNAAKGSALPTVAVAASAGLASPDAGCGELPAGEDVAAGVDAAGGPASDGVRPCPTHQPTPTAPATTIAPAIASQDLLFFPLTANLPVCSTATLLCGGAADLHDAARLSLRGPRFH